MRKVWVVVANRAEMKIYRAENVHTLIQIHYLTHIQSQLTSQELTSDKQGSHRGSFGSDTMEEKTPAKLKEANSFANQIAKVLEDAVNKKEVERIYLIANPQFMGILRQAINPQVAKLIEREIPKDVVHATADQIREYLPPVL